jgi:hypothetical protein
MRSFQAEHHKYRPADELRESTRFPKEPGSDFAAIVDPESAAMPRLEVHDESLGGLSLVLADVSHLPVGLEVGISHAGTLFRACVRHIEIRGDGTYVVGFDCRR